MARASSIDRLPPALREEIGRLRDGGATIDAIVAHLRTLDAPVSRSAVGRHIRGMDQVGERLRQSRVVAETLVRELGDAPESRTARLNIELMHSAILDLYMRSADGETVNEGGAAALAGNPEGLMLFAKALDHLAKAKKADADYVATVEKRAAERAQKAAAGAVEKEARSRGLSADVIASIKASIVGVPL